MSGIYQTKRTNSKCDLGLVNYRTRGLEEITKAEKHLKCTGFAVRQTRVKINSTTHFRCGQDLVIQPHYFVVRNKYKQGQKFVKKKKIFQEQKGLRAVNMYSCLKLYIHLCVAWVLTQQGSEEERTYVGIRSPQPPTGVIGRWVPPFQGPLQSKGYTVKATLCMLYLLQLIL